MNSAITIQKLQYFEQYILANEFITAEFIYSVFYIVVHNAKR